MKKTVSSIQWNTPEELVYAKARAKERDESMSSLVRKLVKKLPVLNNL